MKKENTWLMNIYIYNCKQREGDQYSIAQG